MYAFLKLSPYPPEHPLWLTAGAAAVFGVIFFILPGAEQGRDSLQPPVWGKGNNKQPNAAIAKIEGLAAQKGKVKRIRLEELQ